MPDKEMLSKHFSVEEIRCKDNCKHGKYPQTGIVILLELIRAHFGNKYGTNCIIDVRGGNRCVAHNETVQKKYYPIHNNGKEYIPFSSRSTHMEYGAADFKVFVRRADPKRLEKYRRVQVKPKEVHDFLDDLFPKSLGLGLYNNRNHADIRSKRARW